MLDPTAVPLYVSLFRFANESVAITILRLDGGFHTSRRNIKALGSDICGTRQTLSDLIGKLR